MRPRYEDLFEALSDPDPVRADKAFDSILFDRGNALPDLMEAYTKFKTEPVVRYYIVQLMGFTEDPRAEACRALEDLRARDSLPEIHARLEDMELKVRLAAEETIRALGGWRS